MLGWLRSWAVGCVWLALACGASAEVLRGTYIDCLWEGTPEIRQQDLKPLEGALFNCFATHIRSSALDVPKVGEPQPIDAQFLDACKASGSKVIVIPNVLPPERWKPLVERWPEVIVAIQLQDDAHALKPAELKAKIAATAPHLNGLPGLITVAKSTSDLDYAALAPWYHRQVYLGKLVNNGEGLRKYAYDGMLAARAACPGKLLGAMFLARNPTPYHLRADPVFRAQEFALPSTQEAVAWLQLIAGADHLLSYTAYSVDRDNPLWESRLGERWDLLGAYGAINGKIKEFDSFLSGASVVKGRSAVGKTVVGTWQKPGGELLTVTVDLANELHPRTSWLVTPPAPPPVATSFRFTVDGGRIKAVELP
jgi:hypothetical protein